MYFETWEALSELSPFSKGIWDKEKLVEFLIQACNKRFTENISEFFQKHNNDEVLAALLFEILLDEDEFDGSDALIGAAFYISKLAKPLIRKSKELLQRVQKNNIHSRRPFKNNDDLNWL